MILLVSYLVSTVVADLPGHPHHHYRRSSASRNARRKGGKSRRNFGARYNGRNPRQFDQADVTAIYGVSSPVTADGNFEPVQVQEKGSSSEADFPRPPGGAINFTKGIRNDKGLLCVVKEGIVKSIAKDPILNCVHRNVEKCHYTYVTYFRPNQEEVCEENFEKTCQITFKKQATTETVKKCYRPQQKVCNGQGPEECRTVYESSCTTRYIEKANGKQ